MNVNTGELFNLNNEEAIKKLEEERKAFQEAIQRVPKKLQKEAQKELNGKDYTIVDMQKNTPLTTWAKKERKKLKKKRKIAKKSKKRNRK